MQRRSWFVRALLLASFFGGLLLVTGCESDSDSGKKEPAEEAAVTEEEQEQEDDTPSTDGPRPIVAVGDSITTGSELPGAEPYPARVAAIKSREVINRGEGGLRTCRGASKIEGDLESNPDVVMILYGTNDILGYWNLDESKECLRVIIRATKDIGALPVIGTIPPMTGDMASFMPDVNAMNDRIRALASEEGARLADIAAEFGSGEGLMLPDGFHPNETGTQIIAFSFAGAF